MRNGGGPTEVRRLSTAARIGHTGDHVTPPSYSAVADDPCGYCLEVVATKNWGLGLGW